MQSMQENDILDNKECISQLSSRNSKLEFPHFSSSNLCKNNLLYNSHMKFCIDNYNWPYSSDNAFDETKVKYYSDIHSSKSSLNNHWTNIRTKPGQTFSLSWAWWPEFLEGSIINTIILNL